MGKRNQVVKGSQEEKKKKNITIKFVYTYAYVKLYLRIACIDIFLKS